VACESVGQCQPWSRHSQECLGEVFQGKQDDYLGPEYAFGQIIGDYYASDDVLLIKTAWGGKSLAVDFRPPSAVADRRSEPYPNYSNVEKAQLWAAGVTRPANVLSSDTRPYRETAEDSPLAQGFHWNHNARSYFRIGKALADDMLTLPPAP
jgi:hypothetical protein